MGKRGTGVDYGAIERESLAFMNGDGPSQPQGVLSECSVDLFGNLFGIGVKGIPGIGPCFGLKFKWGRVVGTTYHNACVVKLTYAPDHSVIVVSIAHGSVFDKHNLCLLFQLEGLVCWVGVFGEGSFDRGAETVGEAREQSQFVFVDTLGLNVMGDQTNIPFAFRRVKFGPKPTVELL